MKIYEGVNDQYLVPKSPVILRLDGKSFHRLTKGLERPIDWDFVHCMTDAALAVCSSIDCVKLGYFQSDEISLLLVDYENYLTQPWFSYRIQKICSVAASIASVSFYQALLERLPKLTKLKPVFDCRVFNIPMHEVANYFIWRQQDATRNSISSLAQAHFSGKQLHGKNRKVMLDMLMEEGINWNDCPVYQKRGHAIVKREGQWVADEATPIFTKDRDYIDKHVYVLGDKDPK